MTKERFFYQESKTLSKSRDTSTLALPAKTVDSLLRKHDDKTKTTIMERNSASFLGLVIHHENRHERPAVANVPSRKDIFSRHDDFSIEISTDRVN